MSAMTGSKRRRQRAAMGAGSKGSRGSRKAMVSSTLHRTGQDGFFPQGHRTGRTSQDTQDGLNRSMYTTDLLQDRTGWIFSTRSQDRTKIIVLHILARTTIRQFQRDRKN